MGLKLSQHLRPDNQISIPARINVGNKSNNNACEGLSCFGCQCSVLVQQCMLIDDAKNSRGYFLLSEHLHTVFLVKSRGIVMLSGIYGVFVNDVTKCFCVLMIDVCIICSESHMARSLGGPFMYEYVHVHLCMYSSTRL